jgi:serine/threonine protein kinase
VDGLGFSENIDVESMNSLESLLHTVQQLKLKRFQAEDLEEIRFVAAGETFAVSECKYEGTVVAIKRIQLNEEGKSLERSYFQRRLQSVLREILIMCHPPLAHHPNIINILGYGWSVENQRPSTFISVEFASKGTLREYMKEKEHPIRTKLLLMGDVGAGLMALHKCGIIHGDLKMDNIVVFSSLDRPCMSIAKVSDFGHSIIVGSTSEKKMQYFGTTL